MSDPKVEEAVKLALSRGNRIVIYSDESLHEDIFSLGWDGNGYIRFNTQYGIDPTLYGDVPSEDYVIKLNQRVHKSPKSTLSTYKIDAIYEATPEDLKELEAAKNEIHKVDIAVTKHIPYVRRIPFLNGYPITNNCWADAEGTWNLWQGNIKKKK